MTSSDFDHVWFIGACYLTPAALIVSAFICGYRNGSDWPGKVGFITGCAIFWPITLPLALLVLLVIGVTREAYRTGRWLSNRSKKGGAS